MNKLQQLISQYPGTISYILGIIFINTLFLMMPIITIGHSTMTPADISAGAIYLLRDFAQRELKHRVIIAMCIASLITYFLADTTIAIASFAAFVTAETIDWGIFTWTKKPLSKRLLWSASISAPIDSLVFLHLYTGLHTLDFIAMTSAKFAGITLLFYIWHIRSRRVHATCPI